MIKSIPVAHLRRYEEAESAIRVALQRALLNRANSEQRTPLGIATLEALHKSLFPPGDTEFGSFVRYAAPLIRAIEVEAAERQAMVHAIKLKLVDLEQWLRRLDELDPECVRIIELRYFAGLSIRQVALVMDTPIPDILAQLRFAKAWLQARVRWSVHATR